MTVSLRDTAFDGTAPIKVSICTITYNHADYLAQCIEGFLDQHCDFRVEIIIHDDASTDGTADILREYASRYPDLIIPIFQTDNQYSKGVNPYYAYVFPQSRGEYIAICDGDDFWDDPDKLARQVAYLDSHPKTAITYGRVKAIAANETIDPYKNGLERDLSPMELKTGLAINTLTTCFRNIFRQPPPAFLRSSPIGDMTVWAQLGHVGSGKFMPELLPAGYRHHSGGILSLQAESQQNYMTILGLLNVAAYHTSKGDRKAALACVARATAWIFREIGPAKWLISVVRRYIHEAIKMLQSR